MDVYEWPCNVHFLQAHTEACAGWLMTAWCPQTAVSIPVRCPWTEGAAFGPLVRSSSTDSQVVDEEIDGRECKEIRGVHFHSHCPPGH